MNTQQVRKLLTEVQTNMLIRRQSKRNPTPRDGSSEIEFHFSEFRVTV